MNAKATNEERNHLSVLATVSASIALSILSACGGGGSSGGGTGGGTTTFTVGGTVAGLSGSGLVLQNNGGNNLSVAASGAFTFSNSLTSSSAYAVTVSAQPSNPTQNCAVANGAGSIGGGNVTNVAITCTTNTYTIGGTVSGMTGSGLVLRNNAGNDLTVNANGAFTFTTAIASGAAYAVTVQSNPSNPVNNCSITSGVGTAVAANITNVAVTCVPTTFTVGGTVSGLNGTGLVLQNNGGDNKAISSNGAFVFNTALANASSYAVSVLTQPNSPVQTCSITNGSGTNASGSVINVAVACADVVPRFVYTWNFTDGTISAFRVDPSNGALRPAGYGKVGDGPADTRTVTSPSDPNLGFAYTLNFISRDITATVYNRTTGLSTPIAGSPFKVGRLPAGLAPNGLAAHPNGRFLYVRHQADNSISAYAIDQTTGALTAANASPFALTGVVTPLGMTMSADGDFMYVTSQGTNFIHVYSVNGNTGGLTEIIPNKIATGGTMTGPLLLHKGDALAYAVNSGSSSISAFTRNATTGALTAVSTPSAAGTFPMALGFHPNGKFLYVANRDSNSLSGYAINATTGALTSVGGPYTTGTNPVQYLFDASARFMYVANNGSANISVFGVDDTTGALSAVGAPMASGISPRITTEPSGKYVYASSQTNNLVYAYSINATNGALTTLTNSPTVSTGRGPLFILSTTASTAPVTVTPKYVYVANDNGASAGSASSYSINVTTGALTAIGAPIGAGVNPMSVAVNGKYVYVLNEGSMNVSQYSSNNGVLTSLGTATTTTAGHSIAIDASGRFAYVAHMSTVSAYAINQTTGLLSAIGAPVAAGNFPNSNALDSQGRCAFAPNNGSNNVSAYTINSTTGALTPVSTYATGSFPIASTVDPTGKFLYVTNDGANTVSAYTINGTTCALTAIGGAVSAGPGTFGAAAISIEPTGRFAYVGNEADGNVSVLAINQTTGALSLVGAPVSAGSSVEFINADPSGKFLYVAATPSGGSRGVITYKLDGTTGAIAPVSGAVASAANASALAITAEVQ